MVEIELAYINTKHPDFHKDAALVKSLFKQKEIERPIKMTSRAHNSVSASTSQHQTPSRQAGDNDLMGPPKVSPAHISFRVLICEIYFYCSFSII